MKLKKKWAVLLTTLGIPLLKAKAAWQLYLAVTVLIVGGVMLYQLWQGVKKWLPPTADNPNPTNSVVVSYDITEQQAFDAGWDTNITGTLNPFQVEGIGIGYIAPDVATPDATVGYTAPTATNGFTIQYGLDANGNPWVANASQIVAQDIGTVQTTVNTGTNLTVTIYMAGTGTNGGTITYTTTNQDGDTDGLGLNTARGSSTNLAGDTISYTPNSLAVSTVYVQHSPDLMTWQNIYTDYLSPGSVEFYTDTNTPGPGNPGMNNTNNLTLPADGNPTPPGTGTNLYSPAPGFGSYYRLAMPTLTK